MKTTLDLKSTLVGVVGAFVVACICGATTPANLEVGRFQIATSERGAFVVDTATGQVWQKTIVDTVRIDADNFSGTKLGD